MAKKIKEIITEVKELEGSDKDKAEVIKELEDPLDSPESGKIFVGYHPITGDEVWQ